MADKVKIYCGTSSNLPAGYGRFGNRYECMQCGYGSATMKYKWAQPSRSPKPVERTRKGCYRSRKPKRRSPNRKAKRRSPKRKAKRRSPSRAQINKWILEELNRKRRSK